MDLDGDLVHLGCYDKIPDWMVYKQQELSAQSWRLGGPRSRHGLGCLLVRARFLLKAGAFLLCPSTVVGGSLIPFMRTAPS